MFSLQSKGSALKEIVSFTYPRLTEGKDWFISFYAFNPIAGKLCRKRIKLNHIEKIGNRRKYANGLISRLIKKLESGWNPFFEEENPNAYQTFDEVCERYKEYLIKLNADGALREKTLVCYTNQCKMLERWNLSKKDKITYIYQFDRRICTQFLEYIYIEKNNSPRTRNNYLVWLSTFCNYLVQRMYLKEKPTEGIEMIRRDRHTKSRDVIPENKLLELHNFLEQKNSHYLLACNILYYTFIRPKEMSYLRISDFNIKEQTIFISGRFSKNAKDATVTLPKKIILQMVDLGVFESPSNYFLFSKLFRPGKERVSEKQFSDYWTHVIRKKLGWGLEYKFYSLKDTGITAMLRKHDVLTVRDQARHSSIDITNIYTPQGVQGANDKLKEWEGNL